MNTCREFGEYFANLFIDDTSKVANESLSDITSFLENPDLYLEVTNRNLKFQNDDKDIEYTEVMHTDGQLFTSIVSIANDLIRVNAYTEAIRLYTAMIDRFTEFSKDSMLTKSDVEAIKWSIDEMKNNLMKVISDRDEYSAKRKSVIGKYSDLLNKL